MCLLVNLKNGDSLVSSVCISYYVLQRYHFPSNTGGKSRTYKVEP